MSDDLKADIAQILLDMVIIKGSDKDMRMWKRHVKGVAEQIIDRCMLGAYRAGLNTSAGSLVEEIDRLSYELEAAKALVDTAKLPDAITALTADIERITGENVWLATTIGAIVERVKKRDLDEVVNICRMVERRMLGEDDEGHALH